jgi:hypothetical protein
MFTNTCGVQVASNDWKPNHFVLLLPVFNSDSDLMIEAGLDVSTAIDILNSKRSRMLRKIMIGFIGHFDSMVPMGPGNLEKSWNFINALQVMEKSRNLA